MNDDEIVRRLADGEDPWIIDPEYGCTNPLTGYFPSAEVAAERARREARKSPAMPDRAEIEAVARALAGSIPFDGLTEGSRARLLANARTAIRILDRVRDARGDDEAGRGRFVCEEHDYEGKPPCPGCREMLDARDAARSPQDEGHEETNDAFAVGVGSDPCVDRRTDMAGDEAGRLTQGEDHEAGVAREGLQRILDMDCPLGREGDLLGEAQKIASETISRLSARAGESNEGGNQNDERRH